MNMIEDESTFISELEKQELQAPGGVAPPEVYSKLLALYLYQNDLCNAKFLWKRIPTNLKTSNDELRAVWAVGKAIWLRDAPAIYSSLNNFQWSENVASIMKTLHGVVRERALQLLSQAYTIVNVQTMASLLGLSESEALAVAAEQGWKIENGMVHPVKKTQPIQVLTTSEQQLHILTDFVAFLEN